MSVDSLRIIKQIKVDFNGYLHKIDAMQLFFISNSNTVNTLSREEQAGVLHRHGGQVEGGPRRGRRLADALGAGLAGTGAQEERWTEA